MVTVKQFDDDNCSLKSSAASAQSKNHYISPQGTKFPIYQFGSESLLNGRSCGWPMFASEGKQSGLDSLLLAQWEDHAWAGFLRYDVTACEIKVTEGRRKFVIQLNEEWTSSLFSEFDDVNHLESSPFNNMNEFDDAQWKEFLFYAKTGKKTLPDIIQSASVPCEPIIAIVMNVNPVEYGHVFLVPGGSYNHLQLLDATLLEMVTQFAVEVHNCSFRIICDCTASNSNHMVLEACYFANPLSVELMPVVTIFSKWRKRGICIDEVTDYPIKALLFKANGNLKLLVEVIAEICSHLQKQNMPHTLLLSDSGTKMFLFPQVHDLGRASNKLAAWECGGYFVFNTREAFDGVTEESLSKQLAGVSLDEQAFESVKQLCCSVAGKFIS